MDFSYSNHGSIMILTPVSKAGEQWAAEHLPDDCPMWGRNGYAIEANYFGPIHDGILNDGLAI